MTDAEVRAQADYSAATRRLQAIKPNDTEAENAFGAAYQGLVRLGLARQLRKKYRR